jgi:hypothetical protein
MAETYAELGLAASDGRCPDEASKWGRQALSSHVDLQGMAALEDCWREVTGAATPAPILSYFEARAATRENRKDVAALRKQAATAASLADMREFTLRDLRRAVQEYHATRQPPG